MKPYSGRGNRAPGHDEYGSTTAPKGRAMTMTEQDHIETAQVVTEVLAAYPHLYLATAEDGRPWVGGVYFAETSPFELVIILEAHGRTLTAIRSNPRVGMVVSSGQPHKPFLQGSATVEVLDGAASDEAHRVLAAKVPQIESFLQYPHEAVRLAVSLWRVTDVANGWIPGRTLSGVAGR
jgi:hypothetical protein